MNAITKRIDIDLYSPTSYEVIYAQQGDNLTRIIEFALYNQGSPYIIPNEEHEILAVMEGRRGDHSSFMKDCPIRDNLITATLDGAILYEPGTIYAKIFLYEAETNAILSTIPFQISVQEDPCGKNKIESEKTSAIDWLILQLLKLNTGFASHIKDAISHITASERTTWNEAYEKRHTHSNRTILDNVTASYTREEKNKLAGIQSGAQVNLPSDWKNSVGTFNEIASAYPSPQKGWTVGVKDNGYTYRFNGTEWTAISANAIPKSSTSADGLFSKEDYGRFELLCSEPLSIQQPYAVCRESKTSQAKTVTIPNFILTTGAKVTVKFPNGNSAKSPTLNVSGAGAKEIYYNGAPVSKNFIKRESVHDFVYDGAHWLLVGEKGAGCFHMTCSTAANVRAKTVTLPGFCLAYGTQAIMQFTHGNTAENPTLNIQNTGAYPIYYGGLPIPPEYITENSAVQLVFDGQNRWVVVGDFLQRQIDDLKRFVHYEETHWEEISISQNEGSLFLDQNMTGHGGEVYRDPRSVNVAYAKCAILPYDKDAAYKIVTHIDKNNRPGINVNSIIRAYRNDDTSDSFLLPNHTVSENEINELNGSPYIMDSITNDFPYGDMFLLINSWGSPSDIKVYKRTTYKIW